MLPTEKATGLSIKTLNWRGNTVPRELSFTTNETLIRNQHLISNRNAATNVQDKYEFYTLAIFSDEEIKKGDWRLDIFMDNPVPILADKDYRSEFTGKLIAYTDKLPLNDCTTTWTLEHKYVSQPSIQFVEKYVESYNKGEIITDVLVEYVNKFIGKEYVDDQDAFGYDIFEQVLKVNPKDNTITIKKLRNNWDRNEMTAALNLYREYVWRNGATQMELNEWIKQNL